MAGKGRSAWRRLGWFILFWLAGVTALTVVALAIKFALWL